MVEPLEFEDGPAWLVKTDILAEKMYFSYEKNSLTEIYPLPAEEVKEIISMNRAGRKAASLKGGVEVAMPEFVTAVGDDSITRFDTPKKRKSKNRGRAWRDKKKQQKVQSGGDAS